MFGVDVSSIVVGLQVFDVAGGTQNMYIVVFNLHRVYKRYKRYVYTVGPVIIESSWAEK